MGNYLKRSRFVDYHSSFGIAIYDTGWQVTCSLNDFAYLDDFRHVQRTAGGGRWQSGLKRLTGDRFVLSSNPAAATPLRNFGNSAYPALPVSFGGDTTRISREYIDSRHDSRACLGTRLSHVSQNSLFSLSWSQAIQSRKKDLCSNHDIIFQQETCLFKQE